MFDFHFEIVPTFDLQKNNSFGLKFDSCSVHCFSNDRLWSALDEKSYSHLNRNDYGYGVLDLEVGISGYRGKPYPDVYTKCFVLRTDNDFLIRPMKVSNESSLSKINKRGELVFGLRYYFKSDEEIDKIQSCKMFMFELFVALGHVNNTYGLMCQLVKDDNTWKMQEANTYHLKDADNIKYLMD